MSALYMDGFDHYGTTLPGIPQFGIQNMLDGNWANVGGGNTLNDPAFTLGQPAWGAARTGANCLMLKNISGQAQARKVLTTAQTKVLISFGFAIDSLPQGNFAQAIVDFRSPTNTVLYSLGFSATGQIILYNGPQTSVNTITSGQVLRPQTWHFFEMELDLAGGTFVLRVDDANGSGTPVLTGAVATTGSVQAFSFGQYNVTGFQIVNMYWDDVYVRNDSGTVNNTFQGDRRIATLYANADTDAAGWTPEYYQKFGAGILRLGYAVPNNATPQNLGAFIGAPSATSLDVGAADFTFETFVRFDQLPPSAGYSSIFSRWDTLQDQRSFRLILGGPSYNGACLQFDTSTNGLSGTVTTKIQYPWVPDTNTWYYICIERVAGELLLFVNGEQLGLPIVDSDTYYSPPNVSTAALQCIGGEAQNDGFNNHIVAGTGLVGRFDETRFTNGVGRYTGSFAPPSAAFPRGSGSDAYWSDVVLLCGYNSGIIDESSFVRPITAFNGAVSYIPSDGVGAYSTLNKIIPDDNTFIQAALVPASNILTMTSQPANNDTVTVGTTDGTTPAVYTFKTSVTTAYDVLIDTTAQNTLINLFNAINAGPGVGTKYGTGTLVNFDVSAVQLPVGQIEVQANVSGTAGNAITSTATGTAAVWDTPTLTGGENIPSASAFKFQRPPSNTTIVSALQTVVRATKTDSGLGTIQTAFIGPLGGVTTGTAHPLTLSIDYYNDIIETDPDTSGPLSPTTVIGGEFQINRTA